MIGGGDPWPFGLAADRQTIEALIEYAYSQKIIAVKIGPEAVFAPNALKELLETSRRPHPDPLSEGIGARISVKGPDSVQFPPLKKGVRGDLQHGGLEESHPSPSFSTGGGIGARSFTWRFCSWRERE